MTTVSYDVAIVGAASAGSYFARKMAQQGFKVLLIDRLSYERIGTKYDIFHVPAESFQQYGLPRPQEGDPDFGFTFDDTVAHSPSLKWARCSENHVVGMHMHPYMQRLNRWAAEAGAEVVYEASFRRLRFDEDGKVCGLVYEKDGTEVSVQANLVADCSGIPAVARRSLPDDCVVENFALAPESMYHVRLRYAVYRQPKEARVVSCNWRHYGVWEAPSGNPSGSILGAAAKSSYEAAQKVFARFDRCVPMPEYYIEKEEKGLTPYCRTPYSMVCDGFVSMGDTACINRINGEGVTFALVQSDIAIEVVTPYLKAGKRPTTEALWPINKRYNTVQGAAFAAQKASQLAKPTWSTSEDEYVYLTDVFRYGPQLAGSAYGKPLNLSSEEKQAIRTQAIEEGGLAPEKVDQQLLCTDNADAILLHYLNYPETPEGFDDWCREANRLWSICPGAGAPRKISGEA